MAAGKWVIDPSLIIANPIRGDYSVTATRTVGTGDDAVVQTVTLPSCAGHVDADDTDLGNQLAEGLFDEWKRQYTKPELYPGEPARAVRVLTAAMTKLAELEATIS